MNIEEFLQWFNSIGVHTDNVTVSYSDHHGFGLYSCQPSIEKDSVVLSIPEAIFIKPSYQIEDFSGFEHIILHLLQEKSHPYVKFLRSISCIPSWRRFSTEQYPRQLTNPMKKHLEKYNQSRHKFAQYNDEEFLWAYYAINTRCVHFDMERDSKEQDDNLCLIPYLDFVNHSVQPNTISKFNQTTRSYDIYAIKSIELNEQITFLYNPHSNVDLFIEYGFVLQSNPYNQLKLEDDLQQILSNEQIQLFKSFNYWNSLEFYPGDNDLSWTVIKAIELNFNQTEWSPYDDPSSKELTKKIQEFVKLVQENIEKDFQRWSTEYFLNEKMILYKDFQTILHDTSIVINKSTVVT
ncbi:unnamed protein product [Adineta ricciae]|uniref:SET domain-containing protein n=3 Tax=Adineta ricciae TaxID=249248 RepID=A0A815FHE7_ADIRI|nr:unnamed protein product [Adineta ricciae]